MAASSGTAKLTRPSVATAAGLALRLAADPSADLRGRPTVLLFYRGNWCPLCMNGTPAGMIGYESDAGKTGGASPR